MASRIVTLLPSATEIVCALGFENQLVGRSHECDYPASVSRLPALTAPKFDPGGTSAEIDEHVRKITAQALSVYTVDAAKLKEARPDVIVTQTQCAVCAVSLSDVEAVVAQWTGTRPAIVSLSPCTLADVWADTERIARALGAPERGERLVKELKARCAAVADRAAALEGRPSVACVEWLSPLMTGGNWMPELVEAAGGKNLFGSAGARSARIGFDSLVAAQPDAILICPCGFDIARTLEDLPLLTRNPGWQGLKAVRERRVFVADGNQYFNRPGPRIVESLEILAELIHPEAFGSRREGVGWRRL